MKYLLHPVLLILLSGLNCLGQTPVPTPSPVSISKSSTVSDDEIILTKPLVKVSNPLIKIQNDNQTLIVYLVVSKTDNSASPNYQLQVHYREKRWEEVDGREDSQQASLLIDGKLYNLSNMNIDVSRNESQYTTEPQIKTQTLTFKILPEDINSLGQAKSVSIIWDKVNTAITPEGLDVLRKFVLDENIK